MRYRSRQQQTSLTACQDCHQPCSFSHTSRKQHTKITPSSLQQKLSLPQWKQQKEKIIQSLERIVDEIRECIERVQDSFEQHIAKAMFGADRKLPKKDEKMLADVVRCVWDENYDDITCDQLDLLLQSLDNSSSKNRLNQKFGLVERKIGSEIMEIIQFNLPQQLKRKVQEILDDEIIRIKPQIQDYINKIKSTSEKKVPQQQPQRISQNNHRQEEPRRPIRNDYESESEQSNASNVTSSFVQIDRIREFKGGFNTIVRVLHIEEEEIKVRINGRRCTQFIAGDETGVAIFVFFQSARIKEGNVLKLTNCKIYSFHGDKQVQFSQNSYIQTAFDEINKIGEYRLSNHARSLYENNKQQIKRLFSQRDTFMKKKEPSKTQNQYDRRNDQANYSKVAQSKSQIRGKVKIADILPNDKGLTINGQVMKIYKKQGSRIWFGLGDDTGVVECSVSDDLVKRVLQGSYVKLIGFDCTLDEGCYILLKPSKGARIEPTGVTCRTINTNNHISTKKVKLAETTTKRPANRIDGLSLVNLDRIVGDIVEIKQKAKMKKK